MAITVKTPVMANSTWTSICDASVKEKWAMKRLTNIGRRSGHVKTGASLNRAAFRDMVTGASFIGRTNHATSYLADRVRFRAGDLAGGRAEPRGGGEGRGPGRQGR